MAAREHDYTTEIMSIYGGARVALFGAAAIEADKTVHFWEQECADDATTLETDGALVGHDTDRLVSALTWTIEQRQQLSTTMRTDEKLAQSNHRSWAPKPTVSDPHAAGMLAAVFELSAERTSALLACIQVATHRPTAD